MLLRKVQIKLYDAKKEVHNIQDRAENTYYSRKFLKIFESICAQIYLFSDWLTSSEDILDQKVGREKYFSQFREVWSIKIIVFN